MRGFDLTLDPERRVRRVEIINGAGGRRRWSADDKARILEETLAPGAIVSEVARRHGLRPQQVSGWRREARIEPEAERELPAFVPVRVETPSPAEPLPQTRPKRRRRVAPRSNGGIELEIDGVVVRVGSSASAKAIAAVISALKVGS
ncbi:transposase [Aurantimonas sp. C2-6-R+9]|uniref:IS66-like element accessory protein TnpA n=1 Tax=unclassified Aurantimonas TaxID=2638230 RepID=UPI002E170A35|nr:MULTISPECIES: transposase [unclassified Aurantimonas]MEC5293275.1 transposase [Aurantimonas sp. C2-3-R2]MEC5383410.1 transposase [Aurantimonas sp. C2-6-R+9]MEC5414368.1 transposase [Aurantimonas sp. C2-4-R8]